MRPSRSSTRLAVPAFPDSYVQDACANARARVVLSLGPDPDLGVAPEGGGYGLASEPELPGDRRGAAFARSYMLTPQPND